MKLVSFGVENYRTILGKCTLMLGDYTVFIGKNNQGKTNLLNAIDLFFQCLKRRDSYRLSGFRGEPYLYPPFSFEADYPIKAQNRKNKRTSFSAEFMFSDEETTCFKNEIGIASDGRLCIELSLCESDDGEPSVSWRILKRRRKNADRYKQNIEAIRAFLSNHFLFTYVPAIRTEKDVERAVRDLVLNNIRNKMNSEQYRVLRGQLDELEQMAANEYNNELITTMRQYAPSVSDVHIDYSRKMSLFHSEFAVTINDGVNTPLSRKGSGISSLLVMALANLGHSTNSLTAFEEPECHLHADAIHRLSEYFKTISPSSPLIISTHNPSFVRPQLLSSTYIVSRIGVRQPKDLGEIRNELGLVGTDSLFFCDKVILVEGPTDARILNKALSLFAPEVCKCIESREVEIFPAHGSSKIPFYAQVCRQWVRDCFAVLDRDDAGKEAYDTLTKSLGTANVFLLPPVRAVKNPEIEDCLPPEILVDVLASYGVYVTKEEVLASKVRFHFFLDEHAIESGKDLNQEDVDDIKQMIAERFSRCTLASFDESTKTLWNHIVKSISMWLGLRRGEIEVDSSAEAFEQVSIFGDDDF